MNSDRFVILFSTYFSVAVVLFSVLVVLATLPDTNTIENDVLVTRYVLGTKKTIDITNVEFEPVPEDAKRDLIRTNWTSCGSKRNGHFKNTKTGMQFIFRVTGKGERVFFVKDGVNYIVDLEQI